MKNEDFKKAVKKEADKLGRHLNEVVSDWDCGPYLVARADIIILGVEALFANLLVNIADNEKDFLRIVAGHSDTIIKLGNYYYKEKKEKK